MVQLQQGAMSLPSCGVLVAACLSLCLSLHASLEPPTGCSRREHPVVSYNALSPWMRVFSWPGTRDFSQLVLDLTRNQLLVGARNVLFKLSLANVSLIQASEWAPDEETRLSCQSKGKTEEECQNYIRVLLLRGNDVFTCGTNAFSPTCTSRQGDDISHVLDTVSGVARCPYDPRHNSSAMVTESGELYAATVIDFSGRDPVIYRSLGNMPPLRTAQYNSKWLNEPHFVSGYEVGPFTFFFLREVAVEQDCGRAAVSRVARVCQSDVGGRFLLEGTWTTFMKARLNCSRPGDTPFYFQQLQSTFYLPEQDMVYGVFTTDVNSIPASAVCAFNLSSIAHAFSGPFLYQDNPRSSWQATPNPTPNFQCGRSEEPGAGQNLTERSLQDAQRLFLLSRAVQPVGAEPLLARDGLRLSLVAVDLVQGRDALYHVLYLGTEHGTILKALATTNKSLHGCLLEEMKLLPEGERGSIRSLQILHSDRSLFVGLDDRVVKVPLERCSSYDTERRCLVSRDPYCGWDRKQHRCTTLEESSNMNQWTQNITQCPVMNLTQDGGFSPWAPWQQCNHDDGGDQGLGSACMCRSRACDGPPARCGGKGCRGETIQVANCSRNGGWTPWSPWRPCSTSCGVGFEVRQRSCDSPAPRHGGRVCVGAAREERLCNEQRPCPQLLPWSPWSPWARCSAPCGGGVQARSRTCGAEDSCPGCATEYQACSLEACPEVRRSTPWSPWLPVNVSVGGARREQRARYSCRAPLADPRLLQLGRRRVESRLCGGTNACPPASEEWGGSSRPQDPRWAPWESWSSCSGGCPGGLRTRGRSCTAPDGPVAAASCSGTPVEYQQCHAQACPVHGSWACWSSWSQCSSSCGGGQYQRTRTCTSPAPAHGGLSCVGLHTEEALCSTHTCTAVLPGQEGDQSCGTFTLFQLLAVGAASFFAAVLLSAMGYAVCQRHSPRLPGNSPVTHPSSPNQLSCPAPNNDKYTPMEFKALNKNNLHGNDERCNNFSSLPSTNVYTPAFHPPTLGKYDTPPSYLHS